MPCTTVAPVYRVCCSSISLSLTNYIKLGLEIAIGLELLHERRYLHGDLKLENVGVNIDGNVMSAKLLDLGEAKHDEDDQGFITLKNPGFMP